MSPAIWVRGDLVRSTLTVLVASMLVTASASAAGGSSTAYHPCDGSTTQTASGKTARVGYVANNALPLGTWIEMQKPRRVINRRFFRVMDRGGPGFALDFYAPSCAWMNSWGRRSVTFRAVPRAELYKGRPYEGWDLRVRNGRVRHVWKP